MKALLLLFSAGLLSAASAHAALLIHYTFDSEPAGPLAAGATIANDGTSGIDGSASVGGGSLTITASAEGNYLAITPTGDNLEGTAAPHINTNSTIASLGVAGNQDYTMAAWVRVANQTNDNMIFGGATGDVLHHGSRGGNYWSGHWGDDIN